MTDEPTEPIETTPTMTPDEAQRAGLARLVAAHKRSREVEATVRRIEELRRRNHFAEGLLAVMEAHR